MFAELACHGAEVLISSVTSHSDPVVFGEVDDDGKGRLQFFGGVAHGGDLW